MIVHFKLETVKRQTHMKQRGNSWSMHLLRSEFGLVQYSSGTVVGMKNKAIRGLLLLRGQK